MQKSAFNQNGVILWEGASAIDGAPIVVIATGLAKDSGNTKTGAQIQTFILRADISPTLALTSGADSSVCGDCEHRPALIAAQKERGEEASAPCYVKVWQAPRSVWEAYKRGVYRAVDFAESPELFEGRDVRLGSYGDPAAAPFEVWESMTDRAASHTGYTHQWRTCDSRFASLCMASADSETDAKEAWLAGWRTFRVAAPGTSPIAKREAACPAAKESGQRTVCASCKACGGVTSKARVSMLIWDHSAAGAAKARRFLLARNGVAIAA